LVGHDASWHNAFIVVPIDKLADWERLLAAERHLQHLVPGTVLVGGTAAALHAGHRISLDGDHVLEDLRGHFDEVLGRLEAAAGWRTARVQRPVLILGQLDGVLTGIRQLRCACGSSGDPASGGWAWRAGGRGTRGGGTRGEGR
jgi:hypothetical protein